MARSLTDKSAGARPRRPELSDTYDAIPPNLASLHAGEEFLRSKAIDLIAGAPGGA